MKVAAEMRNLSGMLAFIREGAERAGLDEDRVHRLEVAAEEVLTNIIHYAYKSGSGEIDLQSDRGVVVIKDWGDPFNPLQQSASIDTETPLVDRKVGQLGVLLIRQLVQEVRYKREPDANVLTLRA
jgi:serine/threonine-protein kinase RsbW